MADELRLTVQGQNFVVDAHRPEARKFWQKAALGRWEADTFAFIRDACNPQTTFVDIGAWIGPMTLYASRYARQVISVEPDPVAFRDLSANVEENCSNVRLINAGVDSVEGHLTLYAPSGLGRSVTSSLKSEGAEEITVPTLTFVQLDKFIDDAKALAIKLDIEGHEYKIIDDVIAFLRRRNASFHISVHPRTLYDNLREHSSRFKAKKAIWDATRLLVDKLGALGELRNSATGKRMTTATIFQYIFLRTRVRNFTVELRR